MPWHEAHRVNQRVQFIAAHQSGLYTMKELCALHGISRKTGYKWVARFAAEGVDGLKDRSHAPLHCPHRMSAEATQKILDLRRKKGWGPRKLVARLKLDHPEVAIPSASAAGDLLARRELVKPRRRRRPAHPGTSPLEASAPNDIWSVDFKGEFRTRDGRYCFPLTVSDAYSRFLLGCDGLPSTSTAGAWPCFERVFREYGLPQAIRSDNGTPFASTALRGLSRLSIWWLKLGIVHQRIEPGKPQQNPRHERMHRTLKASTTRPPERNMAEQQRRFDEFRREYNEERPHEALGQKPPASVYAPSTRSMPDVLPEPEYPGHFEKRHVRHTGGFRFRGREIFLSEVLAGEWIALEEVDDGVWSLRFFDQLLARLDEPGGRIYG